MKPHTPLLDTIDFPNDIKKLDRKALDQLAHELRTFILNSVAQTGGHLSSNLGTVELTIALHYVLNTPIDKIVWDVGHQTYAHKILTGRKQQMGSLRQYQGLSGFPKRSESEYDAFGTAHSSTSISAALGMAVASKQMGFNHRHVAVIGDGAMTAGMAFEALNNAGDMKDTDILVILNDNEMSISPPVGALNRYLATLMSGSTVETMRSVGKAVLSKVPPVFEFAKKLEEHAKGFVTPATLFEELGFHYFGPIDGHDLEALIPTLQNLLHQKGPRFLHIVTKKGQGYPYAENDPVLYHGPGKFDPAIGILPSPPKSKTFTQVFSDWVCDMAASDPKLFAITPAMREGSGLVRFQQEYPERYFDVGIAEQHAVTFAAGLACEQGKPVVAIYSTFLQRAYDQLIHDVALQNLDVTFAIDRAGLVGADGATHAGNYDIAFMRCIPNMVIATPSDEQEARLLLSTCYDYAGPAAVRYPRGSGNGAPLSLDLPRCTIGRSVTRRVGKRLAICCFGTYLPLAMQVAETLDLTVIDMRFVKPLDTEALLLIATQVEGIITLEDGSIMGGAGSAVMECLQANRIVMPVLQLGFPDLFIDHGEVAQLMQEHSLTPSAMIDKINGLWQVD